MKKNNKGFVLVETLVVSVAIAAIFSVIYTNIVPVLGDYERTEAYDDLDTKYIAHWMRMLIINKGKSTLGSAIAAASSDHPFMIEVNKKITEDDYMKNGKTIDEFEQDKYNTVINNFCGTPDNPKYFTEPDTCLNFFKQFNVTKLYIVPYNIKDFKTYAEIHLGESPGLQEYIASLADFKDNSKYRRIIVEVEKNTGLKETDDYFTTYATIELNEGVVTDVLSKRS